MTDYTTEERAAVARDLRACGDTHKGEFVSEEVNQLKADVANIAGASKNSVWHKLADLIETAPGAASTDFPAAAMDLLATWMERAAIEAQRIADTMEWATRRRPTWPTSYREKAGAGAGENTVGE